MQRKACLVKLVLVISEGMIVEEIPNKELRLLGESAPSPNNPVHLLGAGAILSTKYLETFP
jgi:hypothetical protein